MEKFQKEYAGVEVDPAADPAVVRTGRLDQVPAATQNRMGAVTGEVRRFADGLLAKLGAAERSFVVSFDLPVGAR